MGDFELQVHPKLAKISALMPSLKFDSSSSQDPFSEAIFSLQAAHFGNLGWTANIPT